MTSYQLPVWLVCTASCAVYVCWGFGILCSRVQGGAGLCGWPILEIPVVVRPWRYMH
jgi:hypothetical protein